ncbi:hypothetical protein K437DRAFT_275747 [Tilletiaria anomala UBC 951]|uniref:SAM domain-containing protein n=1 Tax=Tilletiaria anomala (strain ATCC 24038 / CBS 436.72 / UBC 951) TaxID=1037660 RepID=A0A066VFZ7_TILAU|nr:uncharacterized protein K437DRAFT_275747 [Tilletiaria anomala UBC 951]KDN40356.1 hypothetical protein K437DRAFT_275747 [Tilletiaria anomala UBC 951]
MPATGSTAAMRSPGISTPSRPSGHVRHDSNTSSHSESGSTHSQPSSSRAGGSPCAAPLPAASFSSSTTAVDSPVPVALSRSSSASLSKRGGNKADPHVPAPVSRDTALRESKSQDDCSGFTPGGPVPRGYSYLGRSNSVVTTSRRTVLPTAAKGMHQSTGSKSSAPASSSSSLPPPSPPTYPSSPPQEHGHELAPQPRTRALPPTPSPTAAIAMASAAAVHGDITSAEAAAAMTAGNRVNVVQHADAGASRPPPTAADDRIAAMARVLPANPKVWTPSQVSLYLHSVLRLVPQPIIADVTAYVVSSHMGGKVFLRLREEDLEAEGLNIRWRRLMMEAVRKLRRDCLKGRIWGFEGARYEPSATATAAAPSGLCLDPRSSPSLSSSSPSSSSFSSTLSFDADFGGDAAVDEDEGVAVAVQEAIAAWNAHGRSHVTDDGLPSPSSSSTNRDTLKRLRDKKQIRGVIAAFEAQQLQLPTDERDEDEDGGGFVALSRQDSACSLREQWQREVDQQQQQSSTRADRVREELAHAYADQSGWVRCRAQSYSSLQDEYEQSGVGFKRAAAAVEDGSQDAATTPPTASFTGTPSEINALSASRGHALQKQHRSEIGNEEVQELEQEQEHVFVSEPSRREASELSSSSSGSDVHEALTPAVDAGGQDPFVASHSSSQQTERASALVTADSNEKDLAQLVQPDALGLLRVQPALQHQNECNLFEDSLSTYQAAIQISPPARHAPLGNYSPASAAHALAQPQPPARPSCTKSHCGSDFAEEELASFHDAQAAAAVHEGDDDWDFSSPKFGTARRRVIPALVDMSLQDSAAHLAAHSGQQGVMLAAQAQPTIEARQMQHAHANEAASDAGDSVRSMEHMRNMSAHTQSGFQPYGALSRRSSQRAVPSLLSATIVADEAAEEKQRDAPGSVGASSSPSAPTSQQLADIVSNASEKPILMTEEEVKLVESLGLSARSQGTLGSKRSKGVATLLRRQEQGGGAETSLAGAFGSLRMAAGATSVPGFSKKGDAGCCSANSGLASIGCRAGSSGAHSKMMALFDVPEGKAPVVPPEGFDEPEQEQANVQPAPELQSQPEPTLEHETKIEPEPEQIQESVSAPDHGVPPTPIGSARFKSVKIGEKLSVPLYSIEPSSDGKGSTKKRSMVLVERKRFESLARRMGALEVQIAALESASPKEGASSSSTPHLRQMFDEPQFISPSSNASATRPVVAVEECIGSEDEDDEDEELEVEAKPMLSIGAIPSYMLGLGAGVGFVILSEVLGKFAARR